MYFTMTRRFALIGLLSALFLACKPPEPAPTTGRAIDAGRAPSIAVPAPDVVDCGVAPVRVVTVDDVPLPVACGDASLNASVTGTTLDLPIHEAWPAVNRWNDAMEREYAEFVHRLGAAVEARRCGRLDACLRNPEVNILYDAATERRLSLDVDCADLPYILRGYFAFKRRLPFGYVDLVWGSGPDPRYMLRVRPTKWRNWNDYRTPRSSLRHISEAVHSGMYRINPDQEQGDFYPIVINRRSVVPGTTYYDPNGHVLVVTDVREDGTVFLIDGHPDGSLTWKRFGEEFDLGPKFLWGGFKNFRTQSWDGTNVVRALNRDLPYFSDTQQWDTTLWHSAMPARPLRLPPGAPRGSTPPGLYHLWVRQQLAQPNVARDPLRDFREQVQGLCRAVQDRADAVTIALGLNLHQQNHPDTLPFNIYGTSGDWELYSTPSRDARLKASVREIDEGITTLPTDSPLRAQLRQAWEEERVRPECQYNYTASNGTRIPLSIDAVLDRLFALSFDPYHCPELRWGAASGSQELSTCADGPAKLGWYRAEQRLRNQIDRQYGVRTPLEMGPETPPDVDFRRALGVAAR